MIKNGCFNREPLKDHAWVQSGWTEIQDDFGYSSRMPVMVKIVDDMSKDCVYSRDKKDDPKCLGCNEKLI